MSARLVVVLLALALLTSACRGLLKKEYEYEEELYLELDGSATVHVNASVAALVALRGADLDVNPRTRFDRQRVRAVFEGPEVEVASVSSSRRNGRRFVHVRLETENVAHLPKLAPFAWSTYRLVRRGETLEYRQTVGPAVAKPVGSVGWTGAERVAFRLHLPSRILSENSEGVVERGNILAWEQPLADRLEGAPIDVQAQLETESILSRTLLLFASTILAAAFAFALLIWRVARKGRSGEMLESRP